MAQTDETTSLTLKRAQFWETQHTLDFDPRQQKILQMLLDDFFGKLTVSKYTKITKVSADTSLRDIQDLMSKDIIEQEGSGRSTSYKLITPKMILGNLLKVFYLQSL
jgi:Fic family protein